MTTDVPSILMWLVSLDGPGGVVAAEPPKEDRVTPLWQLIVSGAVGSSLTYVFTWWRERKRMKDAYRAPQREAIGGIIAATHELLLAEGDFRDVIGELAKDGRGQPARQFNDDELDRVAKEFSRAILGIDRAFQVGRLTIVDATCYEKMGRAYNRFVQIKNAFGNIGSIEQTADNLEAATARINEFARQLNSDVADLVVASHKRVFPVQSVWNRYRRRDVAKRLRAEAAFFPTPGDDGDSPPTAVGES